PRHLHSFPTRRSSDLLDTGPWARADLRLDRNLHYRDRLLLAFENGCDSRIRAAPGLDQLGALDFRRFSALGSKYQSLALAYSPRSEEHTSELQSLAYL